jgi:hypothetical protein
LSRRRGQYQRRRRRGKDHCSPLIDQRGFPRRKDGNGDGLARVDIGAVER